MNKPNATQEQPLTLQPIEPPAPRPAPQTVSQPVPQPAPRSKSRSESRGEPRAEPRTELRAEPQPAPHRVARQSSRSRSAPPPHRLPRWLRRAVRAWGRCARWWASPRRQSARFSWTLLAELPELVEEAGPLADRRCGWFDSSQDLREGLAVSEHEAADAVCAQLPVMDWVRMQLAGWRPALDGGEPVLAG